MFRQAEAAGELAFPRVEDGPVDAAISGYHPDRAIAGETPVPRQLSITMAVAVEQVHGRQCPPRRFSRYAATRGLQGEVIAPDRDDPRRPYQRRGRDSFERDAHCVDEI